MNIIKISWAQRNTNTNWAGNGNLKYFDMEHFCSLLFYSSIQLWGVTLCRFFLFSKFVFKFERRFITNSYRSFSFVVLNWLATYMLARRNGVSLNLPYFSCFIFKKDNNKIPFRSVNALLCALFPFSMFSFPLCFGILFSTLYPFSYFD